jgi:hypothetical protein
MSMVIRMSALLLAAAVATASAAESQGAWISLFDGKSLEGWKASEAKDSWKVENSAIVGNGKPRSHLFYVGPEAPFKNFELMVDCWTEPGSNGGIYFHTRFQENNWPRYGYETQVNNTHSDWRKTGSLYGIRDVRGSPAKDRQWWTQHIIVQGKRVVIKVDGETMVDFTEPDNPRGTRRIDEGTFALQAHDPKSVVRFKNIRVKKLD